MPIGNVTHHYPADIRPLTSLRFFAAMTIVFYHFSYFIPPIYNNLTGLLTKGYLAVDFFFILSGFILTHAYVEAMRARTFSSWQFCARRFARIYPLHILTLLVMIPIALSPLHFGPAGYWPGHFSFGAFISNVLLIHGWGVQKTLSFNLFSWSISAEWFAYLCFPALLPWFLKKPPAFLLLVNGTIFSAMWLGWQTLSPGRPLTRLSADFSIFRIMPEFCLGIALYLLCERAPGHAEKWSGRGLALCAAIIYFLLHTAVPDIFLIPCFLFAIYCGAELSRRPDGGGWLARPFAVWLGEISYGVYMVHYIVMLLLLWTVFLAVPHVRYVYLLRYLLPLAALLPVLVAAVLFRLFERPARLFLTRTLIPQRLAAGEPQI